MKRRLCWWSTWVAGGSSQVRVMMLIMKMMVMVRMMIVAVLMVVLTVVTDKDAVDWRSRHHQ